MCRVRNEKKKSDDNYKRVKQIKNKDEEYMSIEGKLGQHTIKRKQE